jgi:hypothetical protein
MLTSPRYDASNFPFRDFAKQRIALHARCSRKYCDKPGLIGIQLFQEFRPATTHSFHLELFK